MSRAPDGLAKALHLINQMGIGLLTTVDHEGHFHTRPLQTLAVDAAGVLWFFTDRASPKADEVRHDLRVSVGYSDPGTKTYVAVSGAGTISRDPRKAAKLWTLGQRAYYPRGPKDPRLGILRVQIEHAEYWIAPGRMSQLLAALRAMLTGTPAEVLGENCKI